MPREKDTSACNNGQPVGSNRDVRQREDNCKQRYDGAIRNIPRLGLSDTLAPRKQRDHRTTVDGRQVSSTSKRLRKGSRASARVRREVQNLSIGSFPISDNYLAAAEAVYGGSIDKVFLSPNEYADYYTGKVITIAENYKSMLYKVLELDPELTNAKNGLNCYPIHAGNKKAIARCNYSLTCPFCRERLILKLLKGKVVCSDEEYVTFTKEYTATNFEGITKMIRKSCEHVKQLRKRFVDTANRYTCINISHDKEHGLCYKLVQAVVCLGAGDSGVKSKVFDKKVVNFTDTVKEVFKYDPLNIDREIPAGVFKNMLNISGFVKVRTGRK